jgi:hypothetical protein
VVTEKMNRVCVVPTGFAMKVKRNEEAGVFIAGLNSEEKFHFTTVVMGLQTSNRHQMGILVNSLRDQDEKTPFSAVGMALNVELKNNATGEKQEALYVCLEDRFGNAEDIVYPRKKKLLLGGFGLGRPSSKVAEPRVYGPKGDELVALAKQQMTRRTISRAK